MKQKQTAVIIVAVILVLLLLFGSRMFYIVKPGERAVLFKTLTGELKKDNIISTGLILVAPWNTFHKYDVKEQKAEETMDVLDKNGLMLNVDITGSLLPEAILMLLLPQDITTPLTGTEPALCCHSTLRE